MCPQEKKMEFNEKQIAIIDAAQKLFAVTGFDGTSVRDIAHEAGINIAMISYYFGSKEKLMEAVFEHKSNLSKIKVESLLQNKELRHIEKVNILIDDYVNKFLTQQEFHKIMMREQVFKQDTQIACLILELKRRNHETIKQLIQDGQKAGEFKKNIDIVLMMATLIGTLSQVICTLPFYRQVNKLEDMSEPEFQVHIRKKLSAHLKNLFKVTLTYEVQ